MVFIAQIWIEHHLKIFVHLYWFNWSIIKVYNWVQWSSFLPTKHNLLSLLFRVWVEVNFPMKSWITYFLSKSLLKSLAEVFFFFSIWVFFCVHSRFTGQQGQGEAIKLIPLYHFQPASQTLRHLDERPPLHIATTTFIIFWDLLMF